MSETTKVTVRLPESTIAMNHANGVILGKNQTEAMAYAIKLTGIILKARADGKAIVFHDRATDKYQEIVIV